MTRWPYYKWAARAAWYRERDNLVEAARYEERLNNMGRCKVCGRQLTDPDSIERGIGPMCNTKTKATPWNE
jgi:hypothetical protein